jgi:hypothetical protein
MNLKNEKIIQMLSYIASNIEDIIPKEKLVKLAYLCDKIFLLKYGETITGDAFKAMQRGAIGSRTMGLLDEKQKYFENDNEALDELRKNFNIEKSRNNITTAVVSLKNANVNIDLLSECEIECIDYVIKEFGNYKTLALSNYAHKWEEWKKYKNNLLENKTKSYDISLIDFFEIDFDDKDDPIVKSINPEILNLTKDICIGRI